MKQLYFRCNSGHYYLASQGHACPLDGWSMPGGVLAIGAAQQAHVAKQDLTIQLLKDAGVPDEALRRIMVIEFGAEESQFEVLDPKGYQVAGEWFDIRHVKRELL